MSSKNVSLGILGVILVVIVAVFATSMADRRGERGDASVVTSSQPGATTSIPGETGNNTTTTGQPNTGSVTVTARLNESVKALNMTVTALEVVEDSRCPTGVQCIQAGTVRVRVRVTSGLGTSEQVIALGGTMTTEAESVKLVAVAPYPTAAMGPRAPDYRFTFELSRR